MTEISMETAFAEACKALGEAVVRERLLGIENAKLLATIEHMSRQSATSPAVT